MDETAERRRIDFLKACIDYFKYLTTLCSGFIIIMIAFLEKFFQKPEWKSLVVVLLLFLLFQSLFRSLLKHI